MMGYITGLYLLTCWVWPFAFVFNLVRAIRGKEMETKVSVTAGQAAVWAGVSLAMLTVVPLYLFLYLKFT